MKTLPDFVRAGIEILSVGLNPSPNSVRSGFPFATPQNRFWRALNASQLVTRHYPPSVASMIELLERERIGFTDVVKRPTAGASALRARDYRRWAPVTRALIGALKPDIVWFHGKVAYVNYARYAGGATVASPEWGEQPATEARTRVFVTPNPSPANAVYSLDDIVRWYDRLAQLREDLRRARSVEERLRR